MLFKPELAQKILLKQKTQTRRLVKSGEELTLCHVKGRGLVKTVLHSLIPFKIKWQVGRFYAIQPGRGKASLGRFNLLDIRRELPRDISEADAIAEGFVSVGEFLEVFESINGKTALDKEVWVLVFEVVE